MTFHIQTLTYLNDLASSSQPSLPKVPPLLSSTVEQPFFLWLSSSGRTLALRAGMCLAL